MQWRCRLLARGRAPADHPICPPTLRGEDACEKHRAHSRRHPSGHGGKHPCVARRGGSRASAKEQSLLRFSPTKAWVRRSRSAPAQGGATDGRAAERYPTSSAQAIPSSAPSSRLPSGNNTRCGKNRLFGELAASTIRKAYSGLPRDIINCCICDSSRRLIDCCRATWSAVRNSPRR